nr:DUF99 family protein [Methanothermococcus okinawensis]
MYIKDEVGVIGIDDAPFNRNDKEALLIGTYYRGNKIIDGIYFKKIHRDGMDSTEKIIEMIMGKHKTKINVIFLDGVTFGGFNIANLYEINEKTNIPVVAVIDRMPNRQKMMDALKKHFEDYEKRIYLLKSFPEPEKISDIYVQYVGIEKELLKMIIQKTRLKSKIPECLRISHLIGRGFLEL